MDARRRKGIECNVRGMGQGREGYSIRDTSSESTFANPSQGRRNPMRINVIARSTWICQDRLLVRNLFPDKKHLTDIPCLVQILSIQSLAAFDDSG